MFRLTIETPEGRENGVWDQAEILIGRGDAVNLRLTDPAASRNHCLLRRNGNRAFLVDLGSVNGVRVGGARVSEARLAPGDEFVIGKTRIRIDSLSATGLALDEPAATPPARRPAPVPSAAGADFGREIRTLLRKTPWYTISLAVHIVALLLLDLVAFSVEHKSLTRSIEAVNRPEGPTPAERFESYEPDLGDLEPTRMEEEFFEQPDRVAPETAPLDEPDAFDYQPEERNLGTGKSLATRIKPLRLAPVVQQGGEGIDRGNLAGEHERAKESVARGLGEDLGRLRGLPRDSIVVIGGEFDKMELILDLYKIPHTFVETNKLYVARKFPRAKMLCINCSRKPTLERKAVQKVKRFITSGGWVITSDWAVDPYLTQAFRGYVSVKPPRKRNADTVVNVQPADATSPLLRGVFGNRSMTRWWLEGDSVFFAVDPHRVDVLVRSEDIETRYGVSDVVAFSFRPGGNGRVLHLLGHFYQKDGNLTGLVAMQRLIINFLRERFLGD